MFGKIWKRAVRKEICNLGKIHGSVADNIFRSLNLHFIKMVDHATVKLFMKQRLKSRSGNGKCIADIADGQFFADMKFQKFQNFTEPFMFCGFFFRRRFVHRRGHIPGGLMFTDQSDQE